MDFYCAECDFRNPIEHLQIVRDATVTFTPKQWHGRWQASPFDADNVNFLDNTEFYCGICGEPVEEPELPEDFWRP